MSKQTKAKLLLTSILGLPILGIVAAYLSYNTGIFKNIGRTNNGELILPPVDLQVLKLESLSSNDRPTTFDDQTWKLIVLANDGCDKQCQQQLYLTRQVHIALGKEADRLERIFISLNNTPLTHNKQQSEFNKVVNVIMKLHPKINIASTDKENIEQQLKNKVPELKNKILLADPLGNIMMYYTQQHSGKEILTDIKHLLKVSRVG
ncbi:hypothetical protein [Spartinivicinus ruber]|uniref:hypothetical protein n=1 Tax=Spartinivicinus ruber TaxID=2683272 RepID=UPI0013D5655B|nr:hypothetical protein [Spartinivicinus ruber]